MTRVRTKRHLVEQTYSPEEVADYCRVHRRTVYRWLSDGKLSASKAGLRTWVITQSQLDAFLKKPEEKKPKEAKPVEKDPIQPELPAELLPTGTGKLAPIVLPDEPVLPPYGNWEQVRLLPGANALKPGSVVPQEPEATPKPETPQTWRGKKRRKGA